MVPGCLALRGEYASIGDPVADLRAAAIRAVEWLGDEVTVLGSEQDRRVGEALLAARGSSAGAVTSYLVVGTGSACRTEKAPGFLDPRAESFDAALGAALRTSSVQALKELDPFLAQELWTDTTPFLTLADLIETSELVGWDYDAVPYGVQYWVARWQTSRSARK